MADYRSRLIVEKNELKEKLDKLKAFIDSESIAKLDERNRELLRSQYMTMKDYLFILESRLAAN